MFTVTLANFAFLHVTTTNVVKYFSSHTPGDKDIISNIYHQSFGGHAHRIASLILLFVLAHMQPSSPLGPQSRHSMNAIEK